MRCDDHYFLVWGRVCVLRGVPVVCVLCVKRSTVFFASVQGGAREPQSGFPDGAGGGVELFYRWAGAGVEVLKSL